MIARMIMNMIINPDSVHVLFTNLHEQSIRSFQSRHNWPSQFGHRPGVVFGGVAAQSQTPLEDEPDFGRWQEVLVATPGRLFPGVTHRVWREGRHVVFGRHFCGI